MLNYPRVVKETNGVFYDLYVIRINKSHKLRYSKPCRECIIFLQKGKIAIRNVYYSTDGGVFIKEKLMSLSSDHLCSASRHKSNV
jgi:hypothetical protein